MNHGRATLNVLDKSWRVLLTLFVIPGILLYLIAGVISQAAEGVCSTLMDMIWRN